VYSVFLIGKALSDEQHSAAENFHRTEDGTGYTPCAVRKGWLLERSAGKHAAN
jgi:hypothetical protein